MTFADHQALRRDQQEALREMEDETQEVLNAEDLLDSEVLAINEVARRIQESVSFQNRELSAVQREIRERYEEIGFVVRVDFYERGAEEHLTGVQIPSITLVRRCEPTGEFDHEQMRHEVRSNILGKNQQGNIQSTQVAPGWDQKSGLIVPGKG